MIFERDPRGAPRHLRDDGTEAPIGHDVELDAAVIRHLRLLPGIVELALPQTGLTFGDGRRSALLVPTVVATWGRSHESRLQIGGRRQDGGTTIFEGKRGVKAADYAACAVG